MGNVHLGKAGIEDPNLWVDDSALPGHVYRCSLGYGKALKTTLCSSPQGPVIVKVFINRHKANDPAFDPGPHERKLRDIRNQLSLFYQPNIIPYQRLVKSRRRGKNTAFLVRQYFANNLYDRINTRPFLTYEEKTWFTYQFISALIQLHEVNIPHGDVKPENIMVLICSGQLF